MRGVRRTKLFRAQTTPPPRPNSTFQSYKFTIFKPSSEFTAGVLKIFFLVSQNFSRKEIAPSLVVHLLQN